MTLSKTMLSHKEKGDNIEVQDSLEKEIFIMVQMHIDEMIDYLKSEDVQQKIMNYIDTYTPQQFKGLNDKAMHHNKKILKRHLKKQVRASVRKLKKIDVMFDKIKSPNAQSYIAGQYDTNEHSIIINNCYANDVGELLPYDVDSFAKNRTSISFTVLHELWHATKLDDLFQNDYIISLNLDLTEGYKKIIDYFTSIRKDQYNKIRKEALLDGSQNIEAIEVGITLHELETKVNDFDSFFFMTMPFEVYPRMKELEKYLQDNDILLSVDNLKKITHELLEHPKTLESYEQLLIMFQGQEEGLLRAMQDIVSVHTSESSNIA